MADMITTKSSVFRFADILVREREFVIVKAGQVQQVEPKGFRVLLILIRNPNRLIAKEELLNAVWGDAAVTENSLARAIALLRRILGDNSRDPQFIETVASVGYRFLPAVEVSEEPAGYLNGIRDADVLNPNGNVKAVPNRDSDAALAVVPSQAGSQIPEVRIDEIPTSQGSRTRWAAGTVAALIGLGLVSWLYFSRPGHALTDKDSVVLAEFENRTGEAVFDGMLRQGLAVQLSQSPFLHLVSDQELQRTLALMGHAQGERLTSDIARQLCQRITAAAVVEGSITSLGSEYVVGLKAVSCRTSEALAEEQVQAARKEDVLNALSRASGELRKKLGESLSTVQKFDTPLDQATTPSLDALLAYSLGRRELILHGNLAAAVPLFQRAIDLDPNFAMAHLSLGLCHHDLGQAGSAAQSIRKAFDLREHVSEWERFAIESRYYFTVIGNLVKARQVYRLWGQIYSREPIPVSVLGEEIDPELGLYEDALTDSREALARGPWNPENYEGLFVAYLNLNQLQAARATADEAKMKKLDSIDLHQHLYQLAFLQKDDQAMAQQTAWAAGKQGVEDVLLSYEADTAAFIGKIERARELSHRAIASAEQAGEKETAADYQAQSAMREALFGYSAEARKQAAGALALSVGREVEARAALALALAGSGSAQSLADDLGRRFHEDTIVQFMFLPMIQAQLALNHGDVAKAIKVLDASAPYELGNASPLNLPLALYPVYVRGNAFLASHRGTEAAVEFQKILGLPGVVLNEPIGALAHKGLARAYALQGKTDKARASYREFMNVWREPDAQIPVLQEAKSEFKYLSHLR